MEVRYQHSPEETATMHTDALRKNFLVQELLQKGQLKMVYTHYDRVIVGGAAPAEKEIILPVYNELKAAYFLERRELGIINVGGTGEIIADQKTYSLRKLDCLYIGKGVQQVIFKSDDSNNPARFYMLSAPAHQSHPVQLMKKEDAS